MQANLLILIISALGVSAGWPAPHPQLLQPHTPPQSPVAQPRTPPRTHAPPVGEYASSGGPEN
jgi:hypothetical protein